MFSQYLGKYCLRITMRFDGNSLINSHNLWILSQNLEKWWGFYENEKITKKTYNNPPIIIILPTLLTQINFKIE